VADTGVMEGIVYDGMVQRVEKSVGGGVSTVYVYDALGVLAAEYSSGAAVTGRPRRVTSAWTRSGRRGW
jgi:hypothetical protein